MVRTLTSLSHDEVNLLNIGLMVASCLAAFSMPFELFLIAYAVLGPLHYLTEISWLHTRRYFTNGRNDYVVLVGLCIGVGILKHVALGVDAAGFATAIVVGAFVAAFAFTFLTSTWAKAAAVVAGLAVGHSLSGQEATRIIFITFIPTIIHVYVFTAAFILYGALKGRSATGIASLGVFAICTASFFVLGDKIGSHALSPYVAASYQSFAELNVKLAAWLGYAGIDALDNVLYSSTGVMLMRFIAFSYTYHYLNWFSKTSIIQWHKIPKAWAVTNVALWLASLAIYAYDYRAGLLTLFSLSFLHVFLEFPLNHRSFQGIAQELVALVRSPATVHPRPIRR